LIAFSKLRRLKVSRGSHSARDSASHDYAVLKRLQLAALMTLDAESICDQARNHRFRGERPNDPVIVDRFAAKRHEGRFKP
jgi:hypothetical protein